jgi:L-iditol 2-dehydrogenase
MKAVVKTKPGDGNLELWDIPEPAPEPGQVKLRIAASGICGTDIHIISGAWPSCPPVALGHEFCGTVVEIGAGVTSLQQGDRVVSSNPAKTCGVCRHCKAGNDFMCPHRVSAGYHIHGSFAEFLCIPAERCHKLADHVTFRAAALGEPLAVAVHAVIERHHVHSGDWVLVSGCGCVGLLTFQMAKLEGARVIITGLAKDSNRLTKAKELGADIVVDVSTQDVLQVVRDLTGGEGADTVYECAGAAKSLDICWKAVKKEGTVVPLGMYPGPVLTDFNSVSKKELRVIGSYGYVWTSWQRCVKLLAEGKVKTEELISHEYPLEDFAKAFEATRTNGIKVVLRPGAQAAG